MGKKKLKEDKKSAVSKENIVKEGKAQKNYSFEHAKGAKVESDLVKVQIPADQEARLVSLILDHKAQQSQQGSASLRLSSKKLTDMYMSLSRAGFKHQQIEQAMTSTVQYGGDLIDALDWLCLNLNNDQLPQKFSEALLSEEERKRPKFVSTRDDSPSGFFTSEDFTVPLASKDGQTKKKGEKEECGSGMKNWILQYAEMSSSEEESEEIPENQDPSERYLELTAKLLDAKSTAAEAKRRGDKKTQTDQSKKIQQLSKEMGDLENHPLFDPQVKISGIDEEKEIQKVQLEAEVAKGLSTDQKEVSGASGGDCDLTGFSLFEEQLAEEKPKNTRVKVSELDKRSFEYSRKQWTGKSPKQFIIDWVRKHLPKSPPPAYHKVPVGGNLWRCRIVIKRGEKEGNLVATPDIVCENFMEAQHLASTLALYQLCKGQRVYQLLPPPYRDAWLEWEERDKKYKDEKKLEENKPRDQLVSRLMKKLKLEDKAATPTKSDDLSAQNTEEEETWEDLLSDDEDEQEDAGKVRAEPSRKPRTINPSKVRQIYKKRLAGDAHQKLLQVRLQLPVSQHREQILSAVNRNSVVVIAGETGSGKSTQIPQFILQESLESSSSDVWNVVVTEPRRISAISLATRVSQEMGETGGPGANQSLVGYQIRFEARRNENTRLLYCTTGVLLRKLQHDPLLADVTHVVVDEVHERNVQSDFLLILLKNILLQRRNFKVILMSATVDSDKFSAYFQHCPVISIPGRTFPVEVSYLEDVIETIQYNLEEDSPCALKKHQLIKEEQTRLSVTGKRGDTHKIEETWSKEDLFRLDLTDLDVANYSLHTRNVVTRMHPERINMELIVELLKYLDTDRMYGAIHGAVLVFLPGLSHIQELYEQLQSDRQFANRKRYKVIPLHSVLTSQDQSEAFDVPPPGCRKIVIATNIAETGITIPDVVFVIDTGKAKENRYVETTQMSVLEEVFVSKASASQRQGRAGRVREGFCFRLYTKQRFETMKKYSVPEILRVPLEELCLHIMKCELGNPLEFLSLALDPPNKQNVSRALSVLREIGACSQDSTLTPLGHHLAVLPVDVRIGKMLIFGAILGCLEPIAVIAAAMSDKSPWVVSLDSRNEVDLAKASSAEANSDHITLYKVFQGWLKVSEQGKEAEMSYCRKCCLKRSTLIDIQNVSRDLVRLVRYIGFDAHDRLGVSGSCVLNSKNISILKSVLTAGLYPRVAKVTFTPKVDAAANETRPVCQAYTRQFHVTIHPGSINRHLATNGWMLYHEKVKQNNIYIKDTTLVSGFPLLLFGGSISVQHREQVITLDDWIQFKARARTAVIFKELRNLLDDLLREKLREPKTSIEDDPVVKCLVDIISSER